MEKEEIFYRKKSNIFPFCVFTIKVFSDKMYGDSLRTLQTEPKLSIYFKEDKFYGKKNKNHGR